MWKNVTRSLQKIFGHNENTEENLRKSKWHLKNHEKIDRSLSVKSSWIPKSNLVLGIQLLPAFGPLSLVFSKQSTELNYSSTKECFSIKHGKLYCRPKKHAAATAAAAFASARSFQYFGPSENNTSLYSDGSKTQRRHIISVHLFSFGRNSYNGPADGL